MHGVVRTPSGMGTVGDGTRLFPRHILLVKVPSVTFVQRLHITHVLEAPNPGSNASCYIIKSVQVVRCWDAHHLYARRSKAISVNATNHSALNMDTDSLYFAMAP
jgi:hypothetical protein